MEIIYEEPSISIFVDILLVTLLLCPSISYLYTVSQKQDKTQKVGRAKKLACNELANGQ